MQMQDEPKGSTFMVSSQMHGSDGWTLVHDGFAFLYSPVMLSGVVFGSLAQLQVNSAKRFPFSSKPWPHDGILKMGGERGRGKGDDARQHMNIFKGGEGEGKGTHTSA